MGHSRSSRGGKQHYHGGSSSGGRARQSVSSNTDAVVMMDCSHAMRRSLILRLLGCRHVWFVKDICGIICAVFTWLLVLYSEYVIVFVMLTQSPSYTHNVIHGAIFQCLTFLAVASHLKAMLTDPVSFLEWLSCSRCTASNSTNGSCRCSFLFFLFF